MSGQCRRIFRLRSRRPVGSGRSSRDTVDHFPLRFQKIALSGLLFAVAVYLGVPRQASAMFDMSRGSWLAIVKRGQDPIVLLIVAPFWALQWLAVVVAIGVLVPPVLFAAFVYSWFKPCDDLLEDKPDAQGMSGRGDHVRRLGRVASQGPRPAVGSPRIG